MVPLAVLSRGRCFGEVAVVADRPRTATVTCVEPTEVLRVGRSSMEALVDNCAGVRRLLEMLIAGRARGTIVKRLELQSHELPAGTSLAHPRRA